GSVQLVPLADDSRSVSKTHLAIMPTRRGLLAVDRGSTNGSALLRGGVETPLVPGQPQPLVAGDSVRFGDRMLRVDQP
ncbi:MAG: FHA domain-containing protein, partial [Microbacterium sp.]|nr:FHA domain-containing protein [Microbacterium sp.]